MEQCGQQLELEFYCAEGPAVSGVNNAVLKALDILDLLGRAPEQLRLMDIALQLDLPESTTHRLLASMAEKGYVQQREHNGPYSLGWKIVTLARSLGTESRLVQEVRPYLEQLLREVKQTVNLGVLNELQVAYLDCLTPNHAVALYTPPGLLVPSYATSLGKALLAHLPPPELEAMLSRLRLEPLTPRSITSRSALEAALDEVRRQGYAVDRGEFHRDVLCVAAPILEPGGRAIASVSVTARAADVAANWEEQTAPLVVKAAQEAARYLFGAALAAR